MKYQIFIVLLLSLISKGLAQNDYTKVPRTRISIIIPEGYSINKSSAGLIKDVNNLIWIAEDYGDNYYEDIDEIKKETFEKRGLKIFDFHDTIVDGFEAKYVVSQLENKNLRLITLILGDSTFSTMIKSIDDSYDESTRVIIMNSLLKLKYDKNKVIDPFESVRFYIDTVSTNIKFKGTRANLYYFSHKKDENIDKKDDKSKIFLFPLETDEKISLNKHALVNIDEMSKDGYYYGILTENKKTYTIGECKALLMEGDCFHELDQKYFCQLILIKDDYGICAFAACDISNEILIKDIKLFFDKIRIK